MAENLATSPEALDVLVVGAGPTGLALATQLARFGVRFRIIDKLVDRTRESRALAVQARSLEVLQAVGLGEALAARARTTTRLQLHVDRGDPVTIDLGDISRSDTRFPYILFVSQAETEAVLAKHLTSCGVTLERGVELAGFHNDSDGISCLLRHGDGREESIRVRYLVGCDGAHSAVRKSAGIPFEGGAYPQEFALGDVEADGSLKPEAINAFGAGPGFAMFFPLGHPATWRVIAIDAGAQSSHDVTHTQDDITTRALSLAEVQTMVDAPTQGKVRLRDPVWLTRFRLHHRQAARYQEGRIFLAGDAAHIHSPVGGQGMNTGIQDAWNLGWKLALVARGRAIGELLESYHAERWPVGRTLLRVTDRAFSLFAKSVSGAAVVMWIRRVLLRGVVGPALLRPRIRGFAFHFVSQLGIHYRASPVVTEGKPPLRSGPKAGDRLPDAPVLHRGHATFLQQELSGSHLSLLLCGAFNSSDLLQLPALVERFADVIVVRRLTRDEAGGDLIDTAGGALATLGVDDAAQYLVRPDSHVAFRCGGRDLDEVVQYLDRWFGSTGRSVS